jgi:NDP-sugar pyrophosphorylase family protein
VVDNNNRPIRLEIRQSLFDDDAGRHGAVVMAGGMGSRMRPLTYKTPKPLLRVDGRPILDHILDNIRKCGLNEVVISVNYLADKIKDHVGDGSEHSLKVAYLAEKNRLGTAGALSLLRPRPRRPFLVVNGDLLTDMDFSKLLKFQKAGGYSIVMCVRKYKMECPYGVVRIQNEYITALEEKPVYEHFINAGIYVIMPSCIDLIPRNTFFDMPDLVNATLKSGGKIGAFPIFEYWRDIGTPDDLTSASIDRYKMNLEAATGRPASVA